MRHRHDARRHGHRRAAAGAADRPVQRTRVQRCAAVAARFGGRPHAQFRHRAARKRNQARGLETFGQGGVNVISRVVEQMRTQAGRKAPAGQARVFQDKGDAAKDAALAPFGGKIAARIGLHISQRVQGLAARVGKFQRACHQFGRGGFVVGQQLGQAQTIPPFVFICPHEVLQP
ncbi:hypothetical protein D3C86_1588450 [compost metagenome]